MICKKMHFSDTQLAQVVCAAEDMLGKHIEELKKQMEKDNICPEHIRIFILNVLVRLVRHGIKYFANTTELNRETVVDLFISSIESLEETFPQKIPEGQTAH